MTVTSKIMNHRLCVCTWAKSLLLLYKVKFKVKMGVYPVAARSLFSHLRRIGRLNLWFERTLYLTQDQCNIRVTTVYLPQVSPGPHLSTIPQGRMYSWVGCRVTDQAGIRTHARRFAVRVANHWASEAYKPSIL